MNMEGIRGPHEVTPTPSSSHAKGETKNCPSPSAAAASHAEFIDKANGSMQGRSFKNITGAPQFNRSLPLFHK